MSTLGQLKTYIEDNFKVIEIEKLWEKSGYTAWYAHVLEEVEPLKLQSKDFKLYSLGETLDAEAWFDVNEAPVGDI